MENLHEIMTKSEQMEEKLVSDDFVKLNLSLVNKIFNSVVGLITSIQKDFQPFRVQFTQQGLGLLYLLAKLFTLKLYLEVFKF